MICPNCNAAVFDDAKFCEYCGAPLPAGAAQQVQPQAQYEPPASGQQSQQSAYQQPAYGQPAGAVPADSKSKVAAGVLAILLGSLGIHKFYLGYTKAGVIMLLATLLGSLLTFGLAALVMEVIGIVEGVIYLTKTDWDFYQVYVLGEKQWF